MEVPFRNVPNRRTINRNNNNNNNPRHHRRQDRSNQVRLIQQDQQNLEHITEENCDENVQSVSYLDVLRQRYPEYYEYLN